LVAVYATQTLFNFNDPPAWRFARWTHRGEALCKFLRQFSNNCHSPRVELRAHIGFDPNMTIKGSVLDFIKQASEHVWINNPFEQQIAL
jgi:hypothetical protein